jgi:hypothetical protein
VFFNPYKNLGNIYTMSVVEPIRRTRKELVITDEVANLDVVGSLEKPKKPRKPATEEQKQKGRDNLARGRALLAEKRAAKLKAQQEIDDRTPKKEVVQEQPKVVEPKQEVIQAPPKKEKKIKRTVVYESESDDTEEEEIVVVKKKKPTKKKIVYEDDESAPVPVPPPAPRNSIITPGAVLKWI